MSDKLLRWKVVNGLRHPVTLSYDGESMTLAPGEKRTITNKDMLGALPNGVRVVPFQK